MKQVGWFQVDLEPNGRLHVVIELDGSASEGKNNVNELDIDSK